MQNNNKKMTLPNFCLSNAQKFMVVSACASKGTKKSLQIAQKAVNSEAITQAEKACLRDMMHAYKSITGAQVGKILFEAMYA